MTNNTMSKMGLAFAVGVALSAGYVALGVQRATPPKVVVVQERCEQDESAVPRSEPESALPEGLAHDPPYYVTDQAELEAMAQRCEVRDDDPVALDDAIAAALGLSAAEREAWEIARARLTGVEAATEFILVHELDPEGTADKTLSDWLRDREGRAESDRTIYRQLAEERAGLRSAMTREELEQSDVWTRALRFRLSTGDRFATELALELGRMRVEELRRKFGGWPGHGVRLVACEGAEPRPAPDGVLIEGDLDRDIVRRVIRAHLSEIRECDAKRNAAKSGAPATLEVEFEIAGDGKVDKVWVSEESTVRDVTVRECVSEAVQRWIFPKPRRGVVHVTYPFEFVAD